MFIEKALNFEGFVVVGVVLYKYREGLLWAGAAKRIFGWIRNWLKLSYRKNTVDFPITWYIQFISKATDSLDDLERADVLLG